MKTRTGRVLVECPVCHRWFSTKAEITYVVRSTKLCSLECAMEYMEETERGSMKRQLQREEKALALLDKYARAARAAVHEAAARGVNHLWVGRDMSGELVFSATRRMPAGVRDSPIVSFCPAGPVETKTLSERELRRWMIKALWAAMDAGLLPERITEETFSKAFLFRA